MSAVVFLNTAMRPSNSGDTSLKLSSRPPAAEKTSRPFNSERTKGRPRMMTPAPSTENRSGSEAFWNLPMLTPGIRCSASATERSARAPMSSAVTASMKVSDSRLKSCALRRDARMPVTITSSTSKTCSSAGSTPASCAQAADPQAMESARPDTVQSALSCQAVDARRSFRRPDTR